MAYHFIIDGKWKNKITIPLDIRLHTEGVSPRPSVSPLAKIEKNVVWFGGQGNKSTNNLLVNICLLYN